MLSLTSQDWYRELIEDCRDIITEATFNSRWVLIEGYHLLGERLLQENKNFARAEIYGEKIAQRVSKSLGRSPRTIQNAIRFAKKYPRLDLLPDGKNTSWHKICNQLLPEPKEARPPQPRFYWCDKHQKWGLTPEQLSEICTH